MEKRVDLDGLEIHYEDTGNPQGEPVIILHGWGCDHTTVRSIASCLDSKMRIINVDLPGHGRSKEPPEVWDSFDFARMVVKLIEKLELKNPSIIGHSFGGRTSIALGSIYPLKKIVLVDSAGIKPLRNIKYYYKVYTYKLIKKLIIGLFGHDKGTGIIDKKIQKRGSADYLAASPMMKRIMSKCVNQDLKKVLPKIKSPVLLVWGENDTATPMRDAKIMEKKIPDCGLVSFPGCGHYSFLDNPIGFKAVIREFFKEELKDK